MVNNPGFELYYDCPIRIGEFNKTVDWFSGNTGTPELYHEDCNSYFYEPIGPALEGEGYAGLILHCQYKEAIEYIGTTLKDSLKAGIKYCIGFSTKAKASPFYIANVGAILRTEDPSISYWGSIRDLFDVRNKTGFITPAEGWVEVQSEYIAKGGERFLMLGNFAEADQTATISDINGMGASPGWMSYYYIDNVYVVKAEQRCQSIDPSELISNTEEAIEHQAQELIVYFDFDSYELSQKEKEKLKEFMSNLDTPSVFLNGHTDSKGSDTYNFRLSEKRAQVVSDYFKSNSKVKFEIKTSFEGETNPSNTNETDEGRALNRRVTVRMKPQNEAE